MRRSSRTTRKRSTGSRGKTVAVPKGSCTDRFAQAEFKRFNIQPKEYLNQNIEVITSNFRAGKLDAAVMWEPTTSRLVDEGLARLVATGKSVQENDGGFLAMRADLIKARPDVVKAWLQAELDAQLFIADPKNAAEVIKMAKEQTTGFSEKVLWNSLYGRYPGAAGGGEMRNTMHYTFTPEARELITRAAAFLHSIKSISTEKVRPEAIESQVDRGDPEGARSQGADRSGEVAAGLAGAEVEGEMR